MAFEPRREGIKRMNGPLAWTASLVTIISLWLYGDRSIFGPAAGVASVFFWVMLTFRMRAWALAPLNAASLALHGRNLFLWW